MHNVVAIIQARMGSTRLPGKALLPLHNGKSVLRHVVDRVLLARHVDHVVVAAPDSTENHPILAACQDWGVDAMLWPREADVLGRFAAVERVYPARHVVRITADCPLLDPFVIDRVIEAARTGADYASNVQPRTFPDGYDVEVISAKLLRALDRIVPDGDPRREHVAHDVLGLIPWAARRAVRNESHGDLSSWRFTLDTWDDYFKIGWLYQQLGPLCMLDHVVAAVKNGQVPA